jgi:hypothetical protein
MTSGARITRSKEGRVKKTATLPMMILFAALALTACPRHEQKHDAGAATTQTIAPAAARPDTAGTDAMTQTVEVDDSRSEEDGGVITNPKSTAKTGAATSTTTAKTSTATTTTTAPPKKKP